MLIIDYLVTQVHVPSHHGVVEKDEEKLNDRCHYVGRKGRRKGSSEEERKREGRVGRKEKEGRNNGGMVGCQGWRERWSNGGWGVRDEKYRLAGYTGVPSHHCVVEEEEEEQRWFGLRTS